jgi:hypothetical protein
MKSSLARLFGVPALSRPSKFLGIAVLVAMLVVVVFVTDGVAHAKPVVAAPRITHGVLGLPDVKPSVNPLTCSWKHLNFTPPYSTNNDEYNGNEGGEVNDGFADPNGGEEGGGDVAMTHLSGGQTGHIDYVNDLYGDGCNDHIVYNHIWEEDFTSGYTWPAHIHIAANEYYTYDVIGRDGLYHCTGITWIRTDYWDLYNVHDSTNLESSQWPTACAPNETDNITTSCGSACGHPGVTVSFAANSPNRYMDNGVSGTVGPNNPQTDPYFSYFQCNNGSSECNPGTAEQPLFFPA